jgi:tRNA modification GTPase
MIRTSRFLRRSHPRLPGGGLFISMVDSTIAAVATPAGFGGISIIKISGPNAIPLAADIFKPASTNHRDNPVSGGFESHRMYYGHIVDDRSDRILDEVLLAVMKAPRSYTREDVVEINCHGGSASVRAILELVLRNGARLAEPGEFTRRAFMNGRIDLTQAEAVIDFINARSIRALEVSAALISGAIRKEVEAARSSCVAILARMEAGIDFPEDVEEAIDGSAMSSSLRQEVIRPMEQLIQNFSKGRAIREGVKIAIIGRPNVGKSSLMNRLLLRERAIVTPYPGTTRDAIEDTLVIQGLAVSLWDTAGLHESGDPVESLGMQKTFEHMDQADLVLVVIEAQRPLSADDFHLYNKIGSKPALLVLNKIDLLDGCSMPAIIPEEWAASPPILVSALTGQGVEKIKEKILEAVRLDGSLEPVEAIIPNLRQKALLDRCVEAAEAAAAGLENGDAPELVDIHLREVLDGMDEILGIGVKTDVLDSIFSRFCIGK